MQAILKGACAAAAIGMGVGLAPMAWAEGAQTQAESAQPAAGFTDAQLEAFAAASAEIEPINAAGAASPEARAQANTQIAAVLARHNLDAATYNGIVEAMRADAQLAARVNAMRAGENAG